MPRSPEAAKNQTRAARCTYLPKKLWQPSIFWDLYLRLISPNTHTCLSGAGSSEPPTLQFRQPFMNRFPAHSLLELFSTAYIFLEVRFCSGCCSFHTTSANRRGRPVLVGTTHLQSELFLKGTHPRRNYSSPKDLMVPIASVWHVGDVRPVLSEVHAKSCSVTCYH